MGLKSFHSVPPTTILAGTLIVTALLLGLVGLVSLVGLLRRRARGARDSG